MASTSKGLILMDKEILFSSSSCSLVLVISLRASCTPPPPPPPTALPPLPEAACFSFCACIMACLLVSASSKRFLFSSASFQDTWNHHREWWWCPADLLWHQLMIAMPLPWPQISQCGQRLPDQSVPSSLATASQMHGGRWSLPSQGQCAHPRISRPIW